MLSLGSKRQARPRGVLSTTSDMTQDMIDAGAQFVATGVDLQLLANSLRSLVTKWQR